MVFCSLVSLSSLIFWSLVKPKSFSEVVDQDMEHRKGGLSVIPRSGLASGLHSNSLASSTATRTGVPRSSLCSHESEVCFQINRPGYGAQGWECSLGLLDRLIGV